MILMDVVGFLVTAAKVVQATGKSRLPTPVCTSDLCQQVERPFEDRTLARAVEDLLGGWSLLKDHSNVSAFRLEDAFVRLQQNNIRTFSDLTVSRNEFSSNENILFFTIPGRLWVRWGWDALTTAHLTPTVRDGTAQLMKKWAPIVLRLLKAANASVQWSEVEKRLEKALMFDVMLATGPATPVYFRRRLTFGDLSKPPFRSQFFARFLPLFNAMLKALSVKFRATTATQFAVPVQLEYLHNLDRKMAQLEFDGDAGLVTLADWLWWTAIYHYHTVYRGKGTCVGLVKAAMPLTVSGMYFKTYTASNAVQKAKVLTAEIENAVRDAVLLETPWMDIETKEAAMDKLNHTLLNICYPKVFLDNWTIIDDLYDKIHVEISFFDTLRSIDKSNSWINVQQLCRRNARNDPFFPVDLILRDAKMYSDRNYIVIPAPLLQPPLFYSSGLDILNYARLGATIGHEFTHVFDIEVEEFEKDGKRLKWWTETTQNNYNARNYTLVDFYNNISTKNNSVDGRHTLVENTADNGGYRAAYLAFHNFMRRTGYRIKLPGLEDLSEEQLFWLTGAQGWCASNPEFSDATHASFRIRVMGPYMNSADFAAAYNCRLGSPMNPRIKV
ncbi:endothelin-converting enzyme 1-like isoform X2 [Paramacrobiotus metropolitanus]|uniref:endothelin-converting enzyme 1-like isoform X2 n=1 Tax=Paramacrobiotus metropolitanus TaxID=2943436 RepID=UPI002445E225|nr:endothelin-converting enzyme 1-like isoform X2 [Paramacrobiotus metropolitanus]